MRAETLLVLGAIGAAVLVAAYVAVKGPTEAAATATTTVIHAAGQVGTGIVLGVGDAVGLPRTDLTECEKALAEGRTWDASFKCPAGTFIKSFF